jgi:hypothetical protein
MALSQAAARFGILISTVALLAPVGTIASEQHLDFEFVVHPIDVKVVEAPNIASQTRSAGKYFGVAFFSDGRIAVKDYIGAKDSLKGSGSFRGYSTYTFEDGSSITASYTGAGTHGTYTILSGNAIFCRRNLQNLGPRHSI